MTGPEEISWHARAAEAASQEKIEALQLQKLKDGFKKLEQEVQAREWKKFVASNTIPKKHQAQILLACSEHLRFEQSHLVALAIKQAKDQLGTAGLAEQFNKAMREARIDQSNLPKP